MTDPPGNPIRGALARTVVTLAIPQGYTLTIGGVFASDVDRFGAPSPPLVMAFVAGAVAVFLVTAAAAGRDLGSPRQFPASGWRVAHVGPLVAVAAGLGVSHAVPWAGLAYPVSAATGVAAYLAVVSAHALIVERLVDPRSDVRTSSAAR